MLPYKVSMVVSASLASPDKVWLSTARVGHDRRKARLNKERAFCDFSSLSFLVWGGGGFLESSLVSRENMSVVVQVALVAFFMRCTIL